LTDVPPHSDESRPVRTTWFPAAVGLALALTVVAYANHFDNAFHFDDSHVIEDNIHIRSLARAHTFFADPGTFSTLSTHHLYRPVLTLSYAVDYQLGGGLNPTSFHVTQFILHLLVGVGLFLVFRRVMDTASPNPLNRYAALFSALLFCLHTGNSETVNYLSSRSDVVSTLGIIGAFVSYLYLPSRRPQHLYLIPMLLGALAKPTAVMFAPLLMVYLLLFEENTSIGDALRRSGRPAVSRVLRRSLPALVTGLLAFWFVDTMAGDGLEYGGGGRLEYLRTQMWVWLHYVRLFVVPVGLTADTDWTLIGTWWDTRVVSGIAAIGVLGWAIVRSSKKPEWRPATFGLSWFVLGNLPASSIFPLAEVANDHRLYLPFAGLALAGGWALFRLALQKSGAKDQGLAWPWTIAALIVLAAHTAGTASRNTVWRSEETLWADVVQKSPGNGRAWMNYGLTQMRLARYEVAREHFQHAIEIRPNYAQAQINMGIVTHALGDTVAADPYFTRAIELAPEYGQGKYFYGRYLVQSGRGPEALPLLLESIAESPAYVPARHMLLGLYYVLGHEEELSALANQTLELAAEDSVASGYASGVPAIDGSENTPYLRGVTLTNRGRHLNAGVAYKSHLQSHGEDASTYNNLGWSMAMMGFYGSAVTAFERAIELDPDFDRARANLRWVQELQRE
jgi:tetratricopeptide (TPR) repeat protein